MDDRERMAFTAMEDALEDLMRLVRKQIREGLDHQPGMHGAVNAGRRALSLAAAFPRADA